jgi:ATP/ADP translocase
MNLEPVVNVPIVMVVYVKNSGYEKIQDQTRMICGWFMGYYAVRAVVVYGTETVTVHQTSTR